MEMRKKEESAAGAGNAAVVNNPTLGENHGQKLTNLLTFVKLQLTCSCTNSIRII
jgi:hypothetical protein